MSRFVRGAAALLLLGGILVGVPALLIVFAGNPFPTVEQLTAIVNWVPDYGRVITTTKILPLLCWAAWLAFAVPFLLEVVAGIRGRVTRKRSPLFRGQQKLAATLVGAIALMFAGGSAVAAAPAHAAGIVATATVDNSTVQPEVEAAAAQVAPALAPQVAPLPAAPQQAVHTVEPGDTLSGIAEGYYGDETRYPEIFDANVGPQEDGRSLTDPDLIHPGQQFVIPGVYTEAPPPPPDPAPAPAPAPIEPDTEPAAPPPVDGDAAAGGDAAGGAEEGGTDIRDEQENPSAATESTDAAGDEIDATVPLMTAGGIAALLAGGVVGALVGRRLQQRRRRAVGERTALPDGAAADLELELRIIENPIGVEDVDNALRTLQAWAEDNGEQLPLLSAVRVADDEVALYLAAPSQLPAPFESQADDGTAWIVRPGMATAPDRPTVSPYPALATVGVDVRGGFLLLDIEQLGSLNIVGDNDTVQGVLTALACEFATNPWSELIQVTLVGVDSGFAKNLDRFRIKQVDDVPALIRNLRGELQDRRGALDSYDLDGVLEARTLATDLEAWPPHVVILGKMPDDDLRRELADLVTRMPRLGIATISNGIEVVPGATVRIGSPEHAEYFSSATARPLPFRPQLLAGEELALVESLYATTTLDASPADLAEEYSRHSRGDIAMPAAVDSAADDPLTSATATGEPEVQSTSPEPEVADETAPQDEAPSADAAQHTAQPVAPAATSTDETADENVTTAQPTPVVVERSVPAEEEQVEADAAPDWPAPLIRVLGPVDAFNIADPDKMPGRGIELLTFLLLQDGPVTGALIQTKMWKDSVDPKNGNTRTLAKQVRAALGSDPYGNLLLPEGTKHDGYNLHPWLRLDWHIFQELIGPNLKQTPNSNLVRALRLVRGTPFDGAARLRGRWGFIATHEVRMREGILDAADELARRALQRGEYSQARFAGRAAEATDPLNEAAWRLEIEAAMKASDTEAFLRAVDEMYACVGGPDIDLDDATQQLIDQAYSTLPGLSGR